MTDTSPIRTSRPLVTRPLSPRDTVPIVANGTTIDRGSLPPIRSIRPASPVAMSPLTSPSPLLSTRVPTPVVTQTPNRAPTPVPTLDELLSPHSVVMTPAPQQPVRVLESPAQRGGQTRRVFYRVRRGQAQPRTLPLPYSITHDGRRNYAELSIDDQYRYQALILSKYNVLRDSNPWLNMPSLDHSLTLDQKHDQYMVYYREVSIHNSAYKYKQYLRLGFRLFELFGVHFLGLRVMRGYADTQESNFSLYEDYLRQMAEKNYEITASQWSLEVRLIVTALIQAALFAVISWVGSYIGGGQVGSVASSIMGMFNRPSAPSTNQDNSGIPEPPRQEGFDLGSILNMAQGFLGSTARPPASRQPAFSE